MQQEKVTKNTIRYAAINEESPVPTVYVKKSGLPEPAPQAITLIIEIGDDVWVKARQNLEENCWFYVDKYGFTILYMELKAHWPRISSLLNTEQVE